MDQIRDDIFGAQQFLADQAELHSKKLEGTLAPYDIQASIAAAGGLLTVPGLQANTVRLQAIAHLAVAHAGGRKTPNKQDAARWFKQVGQVFGHMEDAAEDVFVTRVYLDGVNYRVFEGLAEANGHHLQHILTALEHMPAHGSYARLRHGCRTLLQLSDLICERSGLPAYAVGQPYPLDALPVDDIPTTKTLAARVTFSESDLVDAGLDPEILGGFCLPSNRRAVGVGAHGDSNLERQPLVRFRDAIVVALPSCLGVAIRRAVIETCLRLGTDFALRQSILIAQTDELSLNPIIHSIDFPPTELPRNSQVVPSEPVEFQPGYWCQVILVTDDFVDFEKTGFARPGPSEKTNEDLMTAIDGAAAEIRARPGFKLGMTLIVLCGYGRGQALNFARPPYWMVAGLSSYDLDVLGWRHDCTVEDLMKFLLAEGTAEAMGFPTMAVNGLLARIAAAIENDGHVVPHGAMPDGSHAATILIPTNAHLPLRIEHHHRADKHVVSDYSGTTLVVRRKDGGKRSPGNVQSVYFSQQDARALRYRGVWRRGTRTWWLETAPVEERSPLYPIFEMQMVWMERLAPILAEMAPQLPDELTWKLVTPAWPRLRPSERDNPSIEELQAGIVTTVDRATATVVTEIGLPFYLGLSRPDNRSEVILLEAFAEGVLQLVAGVGIGAQELVRLAVRTDQARQLHAFAPQEFRDHVRADLPTNVVTISRFDDASQRLGLGWHGVPRPGGVVYGRDDCTAALNAITIHAEERLCEYLRQFERGALIRKVVTNHEAAAVDKINWERTSGAILDLSADPANTRSEIHEHILKANAVTYASRVILEASLCESPVDTGFEPADSDLSTMMALAMMIVNLGGYSDAIRFEGMKPELRISPAGEVQIDISFFDAIVTPVGQSFVDGAIDQNRRDYDDLLHAPESVDLEEASRGIDQKFVEAWKAEFGVSLGDFRNALEALENRLHETGKAWEMLPRPVLVQILSEHVDDSEEFVAAIEFLPRIGWKSIPESYTAQDRQPWRFRRRLAVSRRPLLRLDDTPTSLIMVAPGMIRDTFVIQLHNHHSGHYDLAAIRSSEMRAWREHIVAKNADEFEERVAERMRSLGWKAEKGVTFPRILGRKLPTDPGDIDVLAWHPDGRILLLECKDLQFAKTPSEIAKQLAKFRGKRDEKGKPDLLGKHLKRMDLAHEHAAEFQKYLKLNDIRIDGALVFANPVPMTFAADRIGHAVTLLKFADLGATFGEMGPQ
mgnify:CR=1 FL=1